MRYSLLVAVSLWLIAPPRATASCVTLSWTAPGDDGHIGQAAKYEVRYATSPITEANWNSASLAQNPPPPAPAGAREYFTVSDLSGGGTYYFAVKTADEADNWSQLSNVVAKTAPAEDCFGGVGNANCDPHDDVTISDIAAIVGYLFTGQPLCCSLEANANGDPYGAITVGDIVALVEYLFMDGPPLPVCN